MGQVSYKNFEQVSFEDLMVYDSIPDHPFWDLVATYIDFSFADKLCEPLYSPLGQRPYAPSLKLKIHLIQRYYDISDREMELKVVGDIFIKRFLGLPITLSKFDHSTIALDRGRLGDELFHACHMYILAQAVSLGIWGQDDDRWLVDSFHTYANVSIPGTYELIQQATQKLVRHLKRKNPPMYEELKKQMEVGFCFKRLKHETEPPQRKLALSNLAVQAYGLVAWTQSEALKVGFPWRDKREEGVSQEHCELLLRVLRENLTKPDDDEPLRPKTVKGEDTQESTEPRLAYTEISRDQKPSDRVISVHDKDVRAGHKSRSVSFVGDKIQVVESSKSRLVLNAEPIAGNEADGEALPRLVQSVIDEFHCRPTEVVADSAYGSGANRQQLKTMEILLTAPLPKWANPAGGSLFKNDLFTYDPEQNHVVCPGGQTSGRTNYLKNFQGTQHHFKAETCKACPFQSQCTKARDGRTVFVSDYWELIQEAKAYNASERGQEALAARPEIERTNNDMKRHEGLGHPRTRGRKALRIDTKITSMVTNIKVIVKSLTRHRKPMRAPVCP